MAYLTMEYYTDTFKGNVLPVDDAEEFERIVRMASDVIDAAVMIPIDLEKVDADQVAKACAYEAEYLYSEGGVDAIMGKAASQMAVTEKLDDYSISEGQTDTAQAQLKSIDGIPFSGLALAILRSLGLMARWVYADQAKRCCPYG